MRNPTYSGDYVSMPEPDRVISITNFGFGAKEGPILSMGIKIITHNRDGLKLYPHKVVVIEISDGDELASFDINPSLARSYAKRLVEFADTIEGDK